MYPPTFQTMPRYDRETELVSRHGLDYRVRVRNGANIFLWGSAGLVVDITFPKPLFFHIRNDLFGDALTIATQTAGGSTTNYGTLARGECCTIPVHAISGVFASCPTDTMVTCHIRGEV
ncbi:MAG TPA: hypothetical protein VMG98_02220 [Verrucomicrobiae bacterium]|nr:hypothetical protein [Verrucomicrobiae bacterium]